MGGNWIRFFIVVVSIFATTIFVFWGAKIVYKKLLKACVSKITLTKIDCLDGIEFEKLLYYIFRISGYSVRLTKASHDYGADLILIDGKEKFVIQSKHYCSHSVGNSAVQEAFTAKSFYGADGAVVITNSVFSKPAKALAEKSSVILIDRNDLKKVLKNGRINFTQIKHEKTNGYNLSN